MNQNPRTRLHRAVGLSVLAAGALLLIFLLATGQERTAESPAPAARPSAAPVSPSGGNRDALTALALSLPEYPPETLDAPRASRFVRLSLDCVDREYPNKPGSVLNSDEAVVPPRERTPAFFGCFDWHSAVHGHWALARILRLFPQLPEGKEIRARLDAHLTPQKISREVTFFEQENNGTFERPYGWGWLLRLATELRLWKDSDAQRWTAALDPLTRTIVTRLLDYLPKLSRPIREGTHENTAFALVHAMDYARAVEDTSLLSVVRDKAIAFYGQDRACPTNYEPSGEDFISPCLVEADLMRRVLSQEQFARWLADFLPPLDSPAFAPLRFPVEAKDPKDPKIGHLIGLALQRAWSMDGIATTLPEGDPRADVLTRIARLHRHHAVDRMFSAGYGGEHWLASFAVYLMTGAGGDVKPDP